MTITVNGEAIETSAGSVAELVTELAQPAQATLVEHNGTALRRDEWSSAGLRQGDRVELLRVVAGG